LARSIDWDRERADAVLTSGVADAVSVSHAEVSRVHGSRNSLALHRVAISLGRNESHEVCIERTSIVLRANLQIVEPILSLVSTYKVGPSISIVIDRSTAIDHAILSRSNSEEGDQD
jgi:hypothetical protein